MIYDELFAPLLQRPEHFDTYVLPSEWPKVDFTPYRALLLTCKEVKEEATTHFEGHFLRDVIVFFDNVFDLRKFYFKLRRASCLGKLGGMKVCLHSLPEGIERRMNPRGHGKSSFWLLNCDAESCCFDMLICNDDKPSRAPKRYGEDGCGHSGRWPDGSVQHLTTKVSHGIRGNARVNVLRTTGRDGPFQKGLEPISRQLRSRSSTRYTQMVLPIGCLRGHDWLLLRCGNQITLDEYQQEPESSRWPGVKGYEQYLREKYGLDG